MAIVNIDEYANICNIERKNLMTYVGRGKVVIDGEYVDTRHEKNILFFNNREKKGLIDKQRPAPATKTGGVDLKSIRIPSRRSEPINENPSDDEPPPRYRATDSSELMDLEIEKTKRKLEIDRLEIVKREMDIEKKQGEVIPVDMVRGMIVALSKGIVLHVRDLLLKDTDLLIMRYKIDAATGNKRRIDIDEWLNEASVKANIFVKAQISDILGEFAKKKRVGEHG